MAKINLIEKDGVYYKKVGKNEVVASAEEIEIFKAQSNKASGANAPQATEKKNVFFIWLKNTAYINDKDRIGAGFYKVSKVPERLLKLRKSVVEIFEEEVPSRVVAEIARWAGINPDGVKDDNEILEKVITPFTPIV